MASKTTSATHTHKISIRLNSAYFIRFIGALAGRFSYFHLVSRRSVTIPTAATEIEHMFDKAYDKEPVVTVTPKSDPGTRYWVETYLDKFIIKLTDPAASDIEFNWMSQQ